MQVEITNLSMTIICDFNFKLTILRAVDFGLESSRDGKETIHKIATV
jgi:hypothetical protein